MATEKRMVIRVNKNLKMSPGKQAAQAVHAALLLADAHHGGPVIILQGTQKQVEAQEAVTRDAGRTEVEPGAVTAGASFDEREFPEAFNRVFQSSTMILPKGLQLDDPDAFDFALEVKWMGPWIPEEGRGGFAVVPYGRFHGPYLSTSGVWEYGKVSDEDRKNFRWENRDAALSAAIEAVDSYKINGKTWVQWEEHFAKQKG